MTERRFRASIYADVWVEETDDLEVDRLRAEKKVREYQDKIPNSYIGGVALLHKNLTLPLDREI